MRYSYNTASPSLCSPPSLLPPTLQLQDGLFKSTVEDDQGLDSSGMLDVQDGESEATNHQKINLGLLKVSHPLPTAVSVPCVCDCHVSPVPCVSPVLCFFALVNVFSLRVQPDCTQSLDTSNEVFVHTICTQWLTCHSPA